MANMDNLSKDESVVTQAEVHWICLLPRIILTLLFIPLIAESFLGFLLLDLIIIGPVLIRMFTTILVLTNKRIYGKVGLINTKSLDTPLNKINTVSISSGLFGKVFGYGVIHITSSSGNYNYKGIKVPSVFRDAVMEEIERFDEAKIKKQAAEMAAAMKQ